MTHLALRILLGAIGEDGNLLRLAVLDYLSCNLGSLNGGCTKLEVTIVAGSDYSVELNSGICFSVQLLDEKNIAFRYTILLSTVSMIAYIVPGTCLFLKTRCMGRPLLQGALIARGMR